MTTWILGPCSIESKRLFFETAERLVPIMKGRDWYYKASFDKANRTMISGARGPGFEAGVEMFLEFKKQFPDVRLMTDVHECHQVETLSSCIDCIQIPAFLCRQTDLLVECGKHFQKVNIKKGQWLGPDNMIGAIGKVRSLNPRAEVWLCERGTQFGYDRLIVDFRTVDHFASAFDKVILDCTHSTQCSAPNGRTGGNRELAEKYLLCASIFGYSGVFAEVHPEPINALSDADCQIELARVASLIKRHDAIVASSETCRSTTADL